MEVISCATNNKDENEWIKHLQAFNKLNFDKFRVIDANRELEPAEKQSFFDSIFTKLQTTENLNLKYEILQAIRYATRDESLISTISSIEKNQYFLSYARQFDITRKLSNEEEKIFSEIVKVLVNLCLKNRENDLIFNLFKNLEFVDFSLSCLASEYISGSTKFPFCRLLFNFCLDKSIKDFLLDKQVLHIILNELKKLNFKEEEDRVFITELLDLLYICTTHLGPLDGPTPATDDQISVFNELVGVFQEYLFIPIAEFKYLKLKENTIKCLINVPTASTEHFEPERTLDALISFLLHHITYANAHTPAVIVPVLINLAAIARAIERARPIILNAIFPGWENYDLSENGIDPPVQLADVKTPAGRLVNYITTSGTAVSHCVSDLVFALCGDDGDEYVRFLGMGYAAGLLSNRGLLGSINSVAAKSKKTKSTKEMTEEDAKQLYELMERLERGGMIKVLRSEDKNNNNNSEEDGDNE